MSKFFSAIFLLFVVNVLAQKKIDVFIEYQLSMNFRSGSENYNEYLLANDEYSYYFYYKDKLKVEEIAEKFNPDFYSSLVIFKKDDNIFFEHKQFRDENFYTLDQFQKLNWTFNKTTTTYLGFACEEATTYFRGRKYIAWYAKDIPYNYGPWKINGLPGIIVMLKDSDGLFVYAAKKIVLNPKSFFPLNLLNILNNNSFNLMYKDYIEKENEIILKEQSKIISSTPNIIFDSKKIRDLMQEKSFEWEETK